MWCLQLCFALAAFILPNIQGEECGEAPFFRKGKGLFAPIHLANFEGGGDSESIVPDKFKKVIIELGVNNVFTVRDSLGKVKFFDDHYTISFEPLIDKWAWSINTHPGKGMIKRQKLSESYSRGTILPMAVGPKNGVAELKLGLVDGCASILETNKRSKAGAHCKEFHEKRRVPMVTLETVIGWIGPHKSIEFLKIDIQGLDFFAVQSGGASLSRVKRIQLEVPITDHATIGSPDCREVVSKMKALGFRLALTNETNPYTSGRHHGNGNIPLVTADGKSCKSLNTLEADAFFVRSDLTAAA